MSRYDPNPVINSPSWITDPWIRIRNKHLMIYNTVSMLALLKTFCPWLSGFSGLFGLLLNINTSLLSCIAATLNRSKYKGKILTVQLSEGRPLNLCLYNSFFSSPYIFKHTILLDKVLILVITENPVAKYLEGRLTKLEGTVQRDGSGRK
jgi:hypothetical protein